jgi:hypothetical protein
MSNIEAVKHLEAFINEFVPKARKKRWKSLLNFKEPRVGAIEPYDIWPANNDALPYCSLIETRFSEFLRQGSYSKFKNHEVMVIPCGHDDKEPETMSLKEALDGEYYLLEGIISIIQGKLVIMVNHDGEACVFNKLLHT